MIAPAPGTHSLDEITEEARVLLTLIPNRSGLIGIEVGSLRGKTASILLLRRPGLLLWCVDPFYTEGIVEDSSEAVAAAWRRNTRAFGDRVRLCEKPSVEAAADFGAGYADFVYLDAMHDYDSVIADIAAWWPKVRPGGILAGHDYGRLKPAHVQPEEPPWGVERAVHEFLLEVDRPLLHLEATTWAVQKPESGSSNAPDEGSRVSNG